MSITEPPPALSPEIVTASGSPPNSRIYVYHGSVMRRLEETIHSLPGPIAERKFDQANQHSRHLSDTAHRRRGNQRVRAYTESQQLQSCFRSWQVGQKSLVGHFPLRSHHHESIQGPASWSHWLGFAHSGKDNLLRQCWYCYWNWMVGYCQSDNTSDHKRWP